MVYERIKVEEEPEERMGETRCRVNLADSITYVGTPRLMVTGDRGWE